MGWWQEASWILTKDDEERNKQHATTISVLVSFHRIDGMVEKKSNFAMFVQSVLPKHFIIQLKKTDRKDLEGF